jgi:type IV pilus assembly protein PilQ
MKFLLILQSVRSKTRREAHQGDSMSQTKIKKFLAIVLSLGLIGDPLCAAYAPAAGGAADEAAMPSANTPSAAADESAMIPSTTPPGTTASDPNAMFKNTTITMNALPLPKTSISMDFQEADVRDVMHLMAVKSGINIIYGADVTGPLTIHLDRVPFDQAFQTVLTLKGLVALPVGPRIIRVVSASGLTNEQSQAATFTKVFVLKYSNAQEIKAPLDAIRAAAGRKGVSSIDLKNNALIITDTIQGLHEIEDLIPTMDRKPQQVNIEAKIVEVQLDNSTTLGVSWAFSKTSGNNTYGTDLNLADATALGKSAFTFLRQDATMLLQAQLTALASKQRVKILSTPHITTLNNAEATMSVINEIPYQETALLTSGTGGTTQETVKAKTISVGVLLTVRPTINADRRITLKVEPEISNATDAPLLFTGAPPQVNRRKAVTTVLMRDGETIAIGGLISEQNSKTVTGVPLLMSIPLLGALFRNTVDRLQRTELIVFLTPRIANE